MDRGGGAHDWGTGRAMRPDKDSGSSRTPGLLPVDVHHFLVLASDDALPDLGILGLGISTLISTLIPLSIQVLFSKRSWNLVCEELNNESLVLTKRTNLSPAEACFCSFI